MADRERELEFGRAVLAQALGTAIGAGLVGVIAKLAGVLGEVPWARVGLALLIILALTSLGAGLDRLLNAKIDSLHARARRDITDGLGHMTEQEVVAIQKLRDPDIWNHLSEDERSKLLREILTGQSQESAT